MQAGTIAFLLGVVLLKLQPSLPSPSWLLAAMLFILPFYTLNRRITVMSLALVSGLLWSSLYA